MGAKTSKRYSFPKSPLNLFKLFEFFSQWSSKKYCFVLIFEILSFWFSRIFFFFVFVYMGPYGSQNFKNLLLPQIITFELFLTSPEFSSQWSSQKCCFGFCSFEFTIFNEFLKFTIVSYRETGYRVLWIFKWLKSFWGHWVRFQFSASL